MQLTTILPVIFASFAVAVAVPEPVVIFGTLLADVDVTVTDQAQYASVTQKVLHDLSTYQAALTARPEYSSYWSGLVEFQKTHKGVPSALVDPSTTLELTATPSWYVP